MSLYEIRFGGRSVRASLDSPLALRSERGKPFVLEREGATLRFRPLFGSGFSKEGKVPSHGGGAVILQWPGSRPLEIRPLRARKAAFRETSEGVHASTWVAYRVRDGLILETRSVASPESCPKSPEWMVVAVRTPCLPEASTIEKDPFHKFAKKVVGGVFAALLLLLLIPKREVPKEEELIPAQFAKLILTPKKEAAAPNTQPKKTSNPQQLTKAVASKSFQKSFQKLVKGGGFAKMNAFQGFQGLKGATFGPGSGGGLKGSIENAMASVGKGGGVASLGGAQTGYAGAQSGGVSGQGSSFVALDTMGSNVEEGLTRDEVGKVIHAHMSEIRYCYESAMLNTPDLEGKILLDFVIGGTGVVKTAKAKESTIQDRKVAKENSGSGGDQGVGDCVIRRLMTWKFPIPRGGVTVAVTYPFLFKSVRR